MSDIKSNNKTVAPDMRAAIHRLYGLYGRQVYISKRALHVRHEDVALNNSGTWVDVSVFVPDSELVE